MHFDGFEIARMMGELSLGLGIKMFCDNGRIHVSDLWNDVKCWIPGAKPRICDGSAWEVECASRAQVTLETETALPLAAK